MKNYYSLNLKSQKVNLSFQLNHSNNIFIIVFLKWKEMNYKKQVNYKIYKLILEMDFNVLKLFLIYH